MAARKFRACPGTISAPGAFRLWALFHSTTMADFEAAVRRELPVMFRIARSMVNCHDDAEDLVQRSLIRAFRGWTRFDGRHLRSWLLQIMWNENRARFRGPEPPAQLSEVGTPEPFEDGLWETVLRRDQVARIFEKMELLDPRFRLVVQLCDVEGFTYEEVASVLGVPVGTVRSRLFRGRNQLRSMLLEGEHLEVWSG